MTSTDCVSTMFCTLVAGVLLFLVQFMCLWGRFWFFLYFFRNKGKVSLYWFIFLFINKFKWRDEW